jgi:hypothetical protein
MRLLIIIPVLLISSCKQPDAESSFSKLELKVVEFEKFQASCDTASCITYLTESTGKNPLLFCSFIERASYVSIYNYLSHTGFISGYSPSYTYNFSALCNSSHTEIACLINRIDNLVLHEKILQNALKIAGLNLCDSLERVSFTRKYILKSKEIGASELHLISHYLKLDPTNNYFETAFRTVIVQADTNTVRLFLKKVGYISFDRFSDEYTQINPDAISHLSPEIRDLALIKANLLKHTKSN